MFGEVGSFLTPIKKQLTYVNADSGTNYRKTTSFPVFEEGDTFNEYIRKHKTWTAEKLYQAEEPTQPQLPLQEVTGSLQFLSYLYIPSILGECLPVCLIYHSSVNVGGTIYYFGGLRLMTDEERDEYIEDITNNYLVALSHVSVDFNYDLPLPLNGQILKSLFLVPNEDVYAYDTITKTYYKKQLQETYRLDGLGTSMKAELAKTANCTATSGGSLLFRSEMLPPLCCPVTNSLSDRYVIIAGGFEILTQVNKKRSHVQVTKTMKVHDSIWIFDSLACIFRKHNMVLHPTVSLNVPDSYPRFGHQMVVHKYSTSSDPKYFKSFSDRRTDKQQCIIYAMGGYNMDSNNRFIASNDLWRLDMIDLWKGKNGFIVYSKDIVAYPIGGLETVINVTNKSQCTTSSCWPSPRAFFGFAMVDNQDMLESDKSSDPSTCESSVTPRAGTPSPQDDTSSITLPTQFKSILERKLLVVHGGSRIVYKTVKTNDAAGSDGVETFQKHEILGDFWCFNMAEEKWIPIDTYLQSTNNETPMAISPTLIPRCGHSLIYLAGSLMIAGGVHMFSSPSKSFVFSNDDGDILPNQESMFESEEWKRIFKAENVYLDNLSTSSFPYRFFQLNLKTQVWKISPIFIPLSLQSKGIVTTIGSTYTKVNSVIYVSGGEMRLLDVDISRKWLQNFDQGLYGGKANSSAISMNGCVLALTIPLSASDQFDSN
ncbi:cAMP-PKA signaling regulator [Komagataella phaffii CBS 7435]|uniref:Multistep regulator of cAMP-PKA signaling n=2 Tax=Komagataella phaffii TaxID=460519 RepID=C4QVX7_KOMPG|nr:Multistep regulator of cAMP-PKA signaling [Komagataella phaffii GS115]AOA61547.1 GQ67_02604T0 [Komagataella phaffii]CAH2446063.1 cAMP-PKA signaling regulator [Komagataella phaffii CBS 7435]AOA66396.1 GQ68_02644T0 [Komagataella phaffii GS115]CAY67400.1 Multistep regulator of cAMP-PKA signaling [Komagataella phaffii GS115]CCA36500.1 cAMP-PKA signaling regulator [Komagataella phaffii CBS 7435]